MGEIIKPVFNPSGNVPNNAHHPFFSVIVPAHNAAEYIGKGLQSIAEQTFTDYELIVVCDACTDITERIARNFTDKVYCVDFHRDGLTRNVGLDHATGEWILFMDDDDWWLHEYAFQMIADRIGRHGEDIMLFDFIWKGIGYAAQGPKVYYAVWNKCWRREFIGDTRFTGVKYTSDKEFHNAMFAKRPTVSLLNSPLIYYNFMRPGSLGDELQKQGLTYGHEHDKDGQNEESSNVKSDDRDGQNDDTQKGEDNDG